MKPPKGMTLEIGRYIEADQTLEVHVKLRRRSLYCFRLLYRGARSAGLGRPFATWLALRVIAAPGDAA